MTRKNICKEGEEKFPSGRVVARGALVLGSDYTEDRGLPVTLDMFADKVIGIARDMKRDEDGWVTFDISFFNTDYEVSVKDMTVSVYANNVVETIPEGLDSKQVTSATIRGITYFDNTQAGLRRMNL